MRDKHSYVCIRMGLTHLHIQSYLSFLVAVIMALTKEISTSLFYYLLQYGYKILRRHCDADHEAFVACISAAEYREPSRCRPHYHRIVIMTTHSATNGRHHGNSWNSNCFSESIMYEMTWDRLQFDYMDQMDKKSPYVYNIYSTIWISDKKVYILDSLSPSDAYMCQ